VFSAKMHDHATCNIDLVVHELHHRLFIFVEIFDILNLQLPLQLPLLSRNSDREAGFR